MGCKGCGICCKAIAMPTSPEDYKDMASIGVSDAKFISENWEIITEEQVKTINPGYFERVTKAYSEIPEDQRSVTVYWYACKLIGEDNRCPLHTELKKPRVCADYPWYRREPNLDQIFFSLDCGYIKDAEEFIAEKEQVDERYYVQKTSVPQDTM